MKPLKTTIDDDLEAQFRRIAAKEKLKPAALLRQVVLVFLGVADERNGVSNDNELEANRTNEAVLKTTVSEPMANEFAALAKSQGLSNASYLRLLIEEKLRASIEEKQSSDQGGNQPENTDTLKITVYLPEFIKARAVLRGRQKGMRLSRWIASLVQSNVMAEPVMTHNEINQLNASIRELAAIGRNLNQIAKALNENFHETDRLKLTELMALKNVIDNNRDKVRNLVKNSLRSWESEE